MTLSSPLLLLLFLLTPLLLWLGWPSRGASRGREIVSLVLRLIIFASLVLSLAGLELVRAADNLAVVFLVDVSDSMSDAAKGSAVQWVGQAMQDMKPDDKAAIVLFGGDALVEHPMSSAQVVGKFTSVPVTSQTDLSEAIRLALALFPAQAAKRIVILSDGAATTGNAEEAARLAAAAGAQIMAVPLIQNPDAFPEALLTAVHVPPTLRQGEQFDLEMTIESSVPQNTGVRIFAGPDVVYEGTLALDKGAHSYTVPLTAAAPGFVAYRVQLTPASDTFYQNNELAAFAQVKGPPRVLIVTGENKEGTDEGRELAAALQAAHVQLDRVPPSGLPSELPLLAEYASVVLVDVPARELTPRQQTAIAQYVRDLGGGLLAVGGPQSYGVGGYFRTPLEDVLPVDMQLKDQKRRPKLAIVFVIDHSGSMSETSGGAQKIELAKEAAIRAIQLLSPTDKVGVVQFDDSASWVVPITRLDDPDTVINRVASIRSGGGTDILAGVKAVAAELPDDDSQLKHVILLTDGLSDRTGIAALVQQMHDDNNITLSTVAMGRDADTQLLQDLATVGGGRYHFADNAAAIAEIFTEETTLATRAYIIEEPFFPTQVSPGPILAGIDSVPQLLGYVGTTTKQAAQTLLVSNLADGSHDPILAAWQYGLGKAVAWTSDATGRWAQQWVSWPGFATVFVQAVRYTINESVQADISADVKLNGETATLTVDAYDKGGQFVNGLALRANVVAPDGTTQVVDMRQVASGQYRADFNPTEQGAYLIRVAGEQGAATSVGQTSGWVLSYSPEYKNLKADPGALARVAVITPGGIVGAQPSAAFTHNLVARRVATPVWSTLLLWAVLLLPFDIAVRRLVISRYDLQRAVQRVRAWAAGLRRPVAEKTPVESISRLRQAKQRARVSPPPAGEGKGVRVPPVEPAQPDEPAPPSAVTPPSPTPPKPAQPPAEAGTTTASALLAKKRSRK